MSTLSVGMIICYSSFLSEHLLPAFPYLYSHVRGQTDFSSYSHSLYRQVTG